MERNPPNGHRPPTDGVPTPPSNPARPPRAPTGSGHRKPGDWVSAPWAAVALTLAVLLPWIILSLLAIRSEPPRAPSWQTTDIDTGLIMDGLRKTPHFADTFRWFTGTWVGQVPFYRPLTSYLFWFEWKAYGDHELLYRYPTLVLHVLATLAFAAFACRLGTRWRIPWPVLAGLAAACFFHGLPGSERTAVSSPVYGAWKNQPDSAATLFSLLALWNYLDAIEGRRFALARTAGFYLIACGFKEIAVPLPAVCLALEPDLRLWKHGAAIRRILGIGGVGIAFLVLRSMAIGGLGYTYGSNKAAGPRTLGNILGPFHYLASGHWLSPAAVLLITAAVVWVLRPQIRQEITRLGLPAGLVRFRWRILVALLATTGVLSVMGLQDLRGLGAAPPAGFSGLDNWLLALIHCLGLLYQNGQPMAFAVIVIFCLARTVPRFLGIGLTWGVAYFLPLIFSPGPAHRYYLPEGGYLLAAGMAVGFLPVALRALVSLFSRTGQCPQSAIN